ncbi:MAG: HAD-IIB family hydrolase [Planctomycetales bacterium]|nr:HAD-IIB family hydrolase [Planctomycetales bacterium]
MYIQMISAHGLVRSERIEMGRDADTGGQIRYVIELVKTLAEFPSVTQVDLFTRLIRDPEVSDDYRLEFEQLAENAKIVRIPFGPDAYLPKEELWPFLDEMVEGILSYTSRLPDGPAVVHGHYTDAGYVGRQVARELGCPFIFTGHSLGIPKLNYLLNEGWTKERANEVLKIDRRISEEQKCLDAAAGLVVSTNHELDHQYNEYCIPSGVSTQVIPPGTDLERFFPFYDYEIPGKEIDERFKQSRTRMLQELSRFLVDPQRPLILALCRPDRRKNIQSLIQAFGKSHDLQAIANLAIFAGIRKDIESMPENEQQVLTDILLLMDRYDLYGKMAIPKQHDSEFDVPELYRIAAGTRGLFVNSAFIELFGLTAIEASATGLPFVATENGGPQDIVQNCHSGLLVDVTDESSLISTMRDVLTVPARWRELSESGINLVRKHYSWESHCEHYLNWIKTAFGLSVGKSSFPIDPANAMLAGGENASKIRKASHSKHMQSFAEQVHEADAVIISDIDGTLIGDDAKLLRLLDVVRNSHGKIVLGVASGRSIELVRQVFEEYRIQDIHLVIASVGTEIYLGPQLELLTDWSHHIGCEWHPHDLSQILSDLPWLERQTEPHTQGPFKLSYRLRDQDNTQFVYPQLQGLLDRSSLPYNLIMSHGNLVDVLPARASKGQAIQFLSEQLQICPTKLFTAGDSGNDIDMLCGVGQGIVVGNRSTEVEYLRESVDTAIYFSDEEFAAGILDGLRHFGVLPKGIRGNQA